MRRICTATAWATIAGFLCHGLAFAAQAATPSPTTMNITKQPYGQTKDGQPVDLYTCTNSKGLVVKLTNYGATVVRVETPDRTGKLANITLGFPSLDGYLQRHPYFGSTVGRYGNRIAGGKFKLDGQEYSMATNNGSNHLHGGIKGFDAVVWRADEVRTAESVGVKFSHRSPDGDEGYPGTL
ncbi:MAG: galactose-1-epimerase, partial [Pirellulaceae bacterium]|nr:galactose-1-epimerase [Pirellulaceae bacterium]